MFKHRRRRERAERRLAATAENLERLGDLVREVRRQIRPLERQAAAARSHDTVATELLAVRRYLAGAELADLDGPPADRGAEPDRVPGRGARAAPRSSSSTPRPPPPPPSCRRAARRTWRTPWAGCRAWWSGPGALSGVLRERGRAVVAALDANADVDVVSTLEAEAARLASELAVAEAEEAAGYARAQRALTAALEALEEEVGGLRERWSAVLGDDEPDQALARVRARTELMTRSAAREQQDLDALGSRVDSLEQRVAGAAVRADLLEHAAVETDEATAGLAAELASRSTELESIAHGAEEAQVAADEAEQARHRTAARAEALERALSDLQGAGGRELLREVDGVVGSLVDLVEIDDGWDAAFEAAAGAGVAAVVVDGRRSAQAALATLRERGVTGAILAPRQPGAASAATTAWPRQRCRRAAAHSRFEPRPGAPGRSGRRVGARLARGPGGARGRLGGGDRPLARPRRPRRGDARRRPLRRDGLACALEHRRRHRRRGRGGPAPGGGGGGRGRAGRVRT